MTAKGNATAKIFARAIEHHRAGRLHQAEADYRRVLDTDPEHADSLHLLGIIASRLGRSDIAVALIGNAIRIQPFAADYHNNLGLALSALDRLKEAEASYREALRLDPDFAEARNNLGNALKDMRRLDDAERCYRAALRLRPGYAAAHNNLGTILAARDRLDEAEACYRTALGLEPDYPEACNNLANAVRGLGRHAEAEGLCRRALELDPAYAEAHYNLSWVLLLTGQFEEGWREFEWRWRLKSPRPARHPTAPLWTGEPLGDRVLLLHAEQGAGDTFMFCRYVRLAAARGRIVLEVPRPLVRLLSGLPGPESIAAAGEALPPFDLHCPLLSLPLAFGTTLATIPAELPCLSADPALAESWRRRLAALEGLRVGLVWAGNPDQADDGRRSIDPARLAAFADLPGIAFVSLQKGGAAPSGLAIADWTAELGDYADTAALIDGLDLVIGVDTGVIHLAAALGKPVWLLNRFDPYFAWLVGRDDSPWYPGLRQFRQQSPGDWVGVLASARAALVELAADRSPSGY
jgi:tetratricopeptide (TPR) repeat protein